MPDLPLPEVGEWPAATFDDVANASQAYINGIAAVNREIASFLQARFQHDIALGESLARCRTLADASKVQNDWLKQAHDDYTAESHKLFELGSSLMRASSAPAAATRSAKADTSESAGSATK
jgi:hypothetical protein